MKSLNKVGVDEVGRGPLAGPVAVCAFVVSSKNARKAGLLLRGIRDSKKLSESQRETWFEKLSEAKRDGIVDYSVSFVTPKRIDNIGISLSIRKSVNRSLRNLKLNPKTSHIMLDGGLRAPRRFASQETLIKGEDKEKAIAAASVVAKVSRDRRMRYYDKLCPEYGFAKHKGYGTKMHYKALKKLGMCSLHRRSFIHI